MRKTALFLCAVLALTFFLPLTASAETETLLHSFPFDDEAAQGELFTVAEASTIEWVEKAGIGHDDGAALQVTHIEGENYTSAYNHVRLTLAEPLPAGGVYRIVAWIYAPSELNPNKTTLTGPGFVINGDYGGAQGVTKFPENFGTLPMDEWKAIDVTLPEALEPISMLDFRLVINDADKHPDVWYLDNIEIYQVGEVKVIKVPAWDASLPSLKDAFADYFPVGNILEPNQIDNPEVAEMYKNYYNVVTAENSMKPENLARNKGEYTFGGADKLVDWALENNIGVHGHTLVWHSQSPDWLTKTSDGKALTRAEAKANLENYITTVAGHFAGKLVSWDVVNEVFRDGISNPPADWRNALRTDSPWYMAYANGAGEGESAADYIYDAFVLARQTDPAATLYVNDYNENEYGKSSAIAAMVVDINNQWKDDPRNGEPDRLLIEGVGMQSHFWTDDLNPDTVAEVIKRFSNTGAKVIVTELDIPIGGYSNYRNRRGEYTEAEAKRQAELYKAVFKIYMDNKDRIERVTIWGKADTQSWRAEGAPLLFDAFFEPKEAYWSVMELAGIVRPDAPEQTPEETEPSVEPSPETAEPSPSVEPSPSPAAPQDEETEDSKTWVIVLIIVVVVAAGVAVAFFLIKRKKK